MWGITVQIMAEAKKVQCRLSHIGIYDMCQCVFVKEAASRGDAAVDWMVRQWACLLWNLATPCQVAGGL